MAFVDSIFFDLDGTLTDPKIGITRCIQRALGRLGVATAAAEDLTWCIGPPLLDSFKSILGDDALANAALKHYRERFSDTGLFENQVYDGIPSAVRKLSESGVSLYVATSKTQVYAERIVEHFGLAPYFARVFGPTLDGERAQKVELLRFALAEVEVAADTALMVGDRAARVVAVVAPGDRRHAALTAAGAVWRTAQLWGVTVGCDLRSAPLPAPEASASPRPCRRYDSLGGTSRPSKAV